MFRWFDRIVENILAKRLEASQTEIPLKLLTRFLNEHKEINREQYDTLCGRLSNEYLRVYEIVNRSLLRAGIIRAKYICLASGLASLLLVCGINSFASQSIINYFIPLITAFLSMIFSLATIEINYKQRIKAGYDSVIKLYLNELEPSTSYNTMLQAMKQLFITHRPNQDVAPQHHQSVIQSTPDIESGLVSEIQPNNSMLSIGVGQMAV